MNDLPKTNQCHKCKEWFHSVHVCPGDIKLMPAGCTTATGCRQHGCHGECLSNNEGKSMKPEDLIRMTTAAGGNYYGKWQLHQFSTSDLECFAALVLAEKANATVDAETKDSVFQAAIDFIRELTGMEPPPIEVAPPETFLPFKTFTDKVCRIFAEKQSRAEQKALVPAGWKLVPVEPTLKMNAAGFSVPEAEHDPAGVYKSMLAAAPSASHGQGGAGTKEKSDE